MLCRQLAGGEINLIKDQLIPIIGVNECGKTTILSAIFAFDYLNDGLNDNRHLRDTRNLYGTSPGVPKISALVSLDSDSFEVALEEVETDLKPRQIPQIQNQKTPAAAEAAAEAAAAEAAAVTAKLFAELKPSIAKYRRKRRQFPKTLTITRDLDAKKYALDAPGFDDAILNNLIGHELVRYLPYILFFDDFRDSVDETIEIAGTESDLKGWLAILNQLFKQTDKSLSVFQLPGMETRQRKSVLAKVKKRLNQTLTREWQNFRLDESDALELSIEFEQPTGKDGKQKHLLKLEIIETDSNGNEHYFFIRDRSKGFFWFFNFVMKLEFNPKVLDGEPANIYLLDEPGSYLHASAQAKLCRKLRQLSSNNRVIYCTHSHYLLDPEVIPINSIKVAEKSGMGSVKLVSIHDHKGNITDKRSAFQPVIDALQIKPIMVDLAHQQILITEGIYDYYALELFRQNRSIGILPSVGADSIIFYVSLMIAWRISYIALWDNDGQSRKAKDKAVRSFGEDEARNKFFLIPLPHGQTGDRVLPDLFDPVDLVMIRTTLGIPSAASFEKTLAALHFAPEKAGILSKFSGRTRDNFSALFVALGL